VFPRRSIAGRLVLLLGIGVGCILAAVVGYGWRASRDLLEAETKERILAVAAATVARIDAVTSGVEKVVRETALLMDRFPLTAEEKAMLLEDKLRLHGELFGMAASLGGTALPGTVPYVYRGPGGLVRTDLASGAYPMQIMDWYTIPRELLRSVWSEPYFDEGGGNAVMATYSVPLVKELAFAGIVTGDISLEWLTELLGTLPLGSGYAFLLSRNGTFISHPVRDFIMNETVFSIAETLGEPSLRELGKHMVRGGSGFVPFRDFSKKERDATPSHWLAFLPVPSTGWSLGIVLGKEDVLAPVAALSSIQLGLGGAGFLLMLGLVLFVARTITDPLKRLEGIAGKIARGDLDVPVPDLSGGDEVASLAESFARMQADLRTYLAKLAATTAAKERIESELRIAHTIQMELVPKTFPPFPDRKEFDIFALLDPAREVGGDFYDFFFLDETHFCFVVGDVSGKGIPAALFMAVTRTFVKAIAKNASAPGEILARLNDALAEQNESCMFVTLFCAVADLSTGECAFANGGHNLPLLLRRGMAPERLPRLAGCLLGAMEGRHFEEGHLCFGRGDRLFLYTDGVSEAMNEAGAFYSEARLEAELARCAAADDRFANVRSLAMEIRTTVDRFAAGAEQADDVTILVFEFR
jgi:sigma-B regulation protein RsbU (phosphoserine phosphatase)